MSNIVQLEPTIPMRTPQGSGYALLMIDYGQEHHLYWVVVQDATGEIWTWPNTDVRVQNNITMGRKVNEKVDV